MKKEEILERLEDLLETSRENMDYFKRLCEKTQTIYFNNFYEEEYGKAEILEKLIEEVKGVK